MQVIPFIAESAADAVAQIRSELGPDAVVLHVRPLPAEGLSRLWKTARIEVLACKPESSATAVAGLSAPDGLIRSAEEVLAAPMKMPVASSVATPRGAGTAWRVANLLESSGLLPLHVQQVIEQLRAHHGDTPPATLAEELMLTRGALKSLWPALPVTGQSERGPHVFIGPAGTGKTTCLCKWLTQARLIEGRSAQVWRLDGATANTAESLSVYCEILGLSAERMWSAADVDLKSDLCLIDLPGVDWRGPAALRELARRLDELGPVRVHLVLNAAYEVPLLLAQARAFAALPVEDLIFTHLDEETRWGKIWNVVFGTKLPVRFLSAAQNIPGEFAPATAEKILSRQFPL